MFDLHTLDDLGLLRESHELECKLAQGQNGQGEVPKDFWLTYSALANAHGGVVLLGVREKDGVFSVAGLPNAAKVRAVQIPQATRQQRPVYLHGQPLGHTYRRLHESDRLCDEDTVKRMLAEQLEDSRDTRILHGFKLDDIDLDSLHAYRNAFAVHRPGHPWIALDDQAFLQMLGGWRADRISGNAGLTAAGLLMFGRWPAIPEAFPLYFVDYQERSAEPDSPTRWLDRVVPDGTWSGNLYDFFRRVIRKLTADLKVPFALKDGVRIDDTPVHQAVLEMAWARGDKGASAATSEETSEATSAQVVALLRQSPELTARQLAGRLSLSQRAIELQLAKLKAAHKLRRVGPNKGGKWEVLP